MKVLSINSPLKKRISMGVKREVLPHLFYRAVTRFNLEIMKKYQTEQIPDFVQSLSFGYVSSADDHGFFTRPFS